MICNLGVVGSNPTRGSEQAKGDTKADAERGGKILGGFQSGQMGQTVNLLSFDFGGSNPSPPTLKRSCFCGIESKPSAEDCLC